MNRDPLLEAGVPLVIGAGGKLVRLAAEVIADAVRLSARVPRPAGVAPLARRELERWELDLPGDTRLLCEGDDLVATRTLVLPEPDDVRNAAFTLAKQAVTYVQSLYTAGDGAEVQAQRAVASAVSFPQPPAVDVVLGRYFTVPSAQPAWVNPDPSESSTATVRAGEWYEVVQRVGDWAQVRLPDGGLVFTDGRTLMPVTREGRGA